MTKTAHRIVDRKGIARPARRPEGDPVQVYRSLIGWRCSAGCGEPIRWGQPFVQTSADWHPLERAHAACASIDPAIVDELVAEALAQLGVAGVPA